MLLAKAFEFSKQYKKFKLPNINKVLSGRKITSGSGGSNNLIYIKPKYAFKIIPNYRKEWYSKYKQKNDTQLLTLASLLIELFYNDLSISNKEHLNFYSVNKFKLLKKIDDTKRFNLDKKNLSVSIRDVLENA